MEFLTSIYAFITANAVGILAVLGGVNVAASAIVKLTPSQKDDALLEKIVAFVERFSFIFKKPAISTGISSASSK